jgi:hypothetical protein
MHPPRHCDAPVSTDRGTPERFADVEIGQEALDRRTQEDHMAGMFKKIIASGIAAKVIQEARKPQNQAKIKKAINDFQQKRAAQGGRRPSGRSGSF